jgi:glycosyltransferase involved in cell wall biosynthesis
MIIINAIRGISESSMPWSDLYCNIFDTGEGFTYHDPIVIRGLFGGVKREEKFCKSRGVSKPYLIIPIATIFVYIAKIIAKNFRSEKICIHVHSPSLLLIFVIFRLVGARIILTVHNKPGGFSWINFISILIGTVFLNKINTVSVSVKQELISILPWLKGKTVVIRNAFIANSDYLKLNQKKRNSIVIVSRFVKQKNCFFLVDVLSKLIYCESILWFGSGPLFDQVSNYAEKVGVNICFMGEVPRSELYKYMSESDIYLMASKWEGIGVSTIEAAFFGCYVLISDIGPHREIYQLTENQISLAPLDDVDIWVRKIHSYINTEDSEKKLLSLKLSNTTKNNFPLNDMINLYINLYKSIN